MPTVVHVKLPNEMILKPPPKCLLIADAYK